MSSTNNMAVTTVSNLVMYQAETLEERLHGILSDNGGKTSLEGSSIKIFDIEYYNAMSGYNYWNDDVLIAQLYMGTLLSGTYVVYKRIFIDEKITEQYDYYDAHGRFFYSSHSLDGQCITYNSITMDPTSPFLNHIYNILYTEYEGTTFNYGNTGRIHFLENFLENVFQKETSTISVKDGLNDIALKNIAREILSIENNTVLKWTERQTIFKQLKESRSKIMSTKRRAHGFQYMLYDFVIRIKDIKLKYRTFKQRPFNNAMGNLYKYTLGNFFWFAETVRSNMGYSVAMAIYGPFTFYFITQPMNPHAMWAVGKVRNAYINVSESLEPEEANSYLVEDDEDKVKVGQAAPEKLKKKIVKKVNWTSRMDNFKAMQIAYESAMVFSERMGRIEQFETQLNFPLTAEAAWMEMELYYKDIEGKIEYFRNLDERMVKFLNHEKERTLELQFYIWQKMGQFFIDYPHIVVDQEAEQTQRNYYLGRQFVFFKKITEKLTNMGIANSPKTHKNIDMLAKKFSKMKIEGTGVLDTLRKNSKIFQQKNYLSSDEHRDYMKRHWEVLFMQQNKKQEASSFSLQAYTWSVKNALWLLQTIYSAKRSELWKHVSNYNLDTTTAPKEKPTLAMNEYLENMFNNMVMEYVSMKKEMVANLPGDNEAYLRENVINNVKSYLIERDKLFNNGHYALNDK